MRQATICLLIKDCQILLGMKKRGFGEGRWNGCGGKVKEDINETPEQCIVRETKEEFDVTMKEFKHVAKIEFSFPHKPEWGQQVFIYLCTKWDGKPTESEEMRPKWFDIAEIPYDQMWVDGLYWLPKVLNGEFVEAKCIFNKDNSIKEFKFFNKSTV